MAPKTKPLVHNYDGFACVANGCGATTAKTWNFCDEIQEPVGSTQQTAKGGDGTHGYRRWLCAGNSGAAHRAVRERESGWQRWDGSDLPAMSTTVRMGLCLVCPHNHGATHGMNVSIDEGADLRVPEEQYIHVYCERVPQEARRW